jgi:serralysin
MTKRARARGGSAEFNGIESNIAHGLRRCGRKTGLTPAIRRGAVHMASVLPSVTETVDAAASTSTAYSLGIGQSAQGKISALGDHDWYKVNLVAGQTYSFALIGTGTNSLRNTFLALRNSAGTIIATDDDGGPGYSSRITFTASASGTYYLDAGAVYDGLTGQYGISASTGTKPNFDVPMGGGAIDAYASWSTPGTGAVITYGFRQSAPGYSVSGHNIGTFTQVSAAEMAAVQQVLQLWGDVANVTFQQVNPGGYTNNATILIGNYADAGDGAGAFAFYPGSTSGSSSAGDLWLNLSGGVSTSSIPVGSYSFFAIMHELGHALGLSHPGDYNAAPGQTITYANNAQFAQDSEQSSVMSYFGGAATGETPGGFASAYTPMLFDIYELQQIYGANTTTRTGNTTYGFGSTAGSIYAFSAGSTPQYCIWDAGGTDTLNCSGYGQAQLINLNQGTFSSIGGGSGNISIAVGATIENANGGSGNDTIVGNDANNTFTGGGGNDTIDGGAGRDVTIFNCASSAATVVHNANGTWTITAPGQTETLTNVEVAQFTDHAVTLGAPTYMDLTGNGTSGVIWRNSTTGAVETWLMTNGTMSGGGGLGSASGAWTAVAVGDFNGDGTADVLWRNNNSGVVESWLLANGKIGGGTGVSMAASVWQAAGGGDFDGDGTTDVLWRNIATGEVDTWLISNGHVSGGTAIGTASSAWQALGTGDVNGDGTTDVLWRNSTTGEVDAWLINNGHVTGITSIGSATGAWQGLGTGDVDGNGTADVLWLNTSTGEVDGWLMSNGQVSGATVIGTMASTWQFESTGDFNGDGTTDILWRNTATGQVSAWLIGNGHIIGGGAIGTATGAWSPTMNASPAPALSASGGSLIYPSASAAPSALAPEGLEGTSTGAPLLAQGVDAASRDSLADAVTPDLVYRDPSWTDGSSLGPDALPSLASLDPRGLGHS